MSTCGVDYNKFVLEIFVVFTQVSMDIKAGYRITWSLDQVFRECK